MRACCVCAVRRNNAPVFSRPALSLSHTHTKCKINKQTQDDDDDPLGEDDEMPWYRRPLVLAHVVAFTVAAALLIVGVCTQLLVPALRPGGAGGGKEGKYSAGGVELFRWMYFFCIWPLLWVRYFVFYVLLFAHRCFVKRRRRRKQQPTSPP